jgi:hypothetical protein
MSHDPLPNHLEAIGRQLTAAARDLASPAGQASFAASRSVRQRLGLSRPRVLARASLGLAGVAAAAVLAVGALGTSSSPAFAITRHNGTVSVTINQRSAITAANRRLAVMGIHERVFALGDALGKSIPIIQQPSNAPALEYPLGANHRRRPTNRSA